jgi:hypothetical protein
MPQDVVVWHLGLDSSRRRDFPRVTPSALQAALELVQRREGRKLVRLVPAARAIGAGLT